MQLIGYPIGIRSERRFCEKSDLNLTHRWFFRLDPGDRAPDHPTFSKHRHGKFCKSDQQRLVFKGVVARRI